MSSEFTRRSAFPFRYDSSGNPVTLADFYSATTATADTLPYYLGAYGVDFTQGFGHVRLTNAFALDGGFDTFLYEPTLGAYASWAVAYQVDDAAQAVAVTLVWNDPPGSEYCGYMYANGTGDGCLVHDLDLVVTVGGTRVFANFGAGTGTYAGQEDTANNVEKVTVFPASMNLNDVVLVTVVSHGLPYASTQKFSVVVTGVVTKVENPTSAPTVSPMPTIDCHDDNDLALASFNLTCSDINQFVCANFLCSDSPNCTYPHTCDASCGFCGAVTPAPSVAVTPAPTTHCGDDDQMAVVYFNGSTCADYAMSGNLAFLCETTLCPTCTLPHVCDESCGFCDSAPPTMSPAPTNSPMPTIDCHDNDAAATPIFNATCAELAVYDSITGICADYFCPDCVYGKYCDVSCDFCNATNSPCGDNDVKAALFFNESTCAEALSLGVTRSYSCDNYFCPTCPYPNTCDGTCGFCDSAPPTVSPAPTASPMPTPACHDDDDLALASFNLTCSDVVQSEGACDNFLCSDSPNCTYPHTCDASCGFCGAVTPAPSVAVTPAPTLPPSPVPTLAPTAADTALVEVLWAMAASAPPTDGDKATLKSKIATQLEIDPTTGMKNFNVASQTARRLAPGRRALLAETWTVTFDIVSTTGSAAAESASAVEALEDATFEAAVKTDISSIDSFEAPVAVVQTRHPSPQPSPQPSAQPVPAPTV